jgi:hypothetical protein
LLTSNCHQQARKLMITTSANDGTCRLKQLFN